MITGIFPVNREALPPLAGYLLDLTTDDDPARIGGRLAYELRRRTGGHWFWSRLSRHLVGDQLYTVEQLKQLCRDLWSAPNGVFGGLRTIQLDEQWQAGPGEQADYVALGLADELAEELKQALQPFHEELLPALEIWHLYHLRGWLVQGEPAISLSVSSQPVLNQFKAITVGNDIPSQVVLFSTLKGQDFAAANIALGLLSKMGGIPYVLAEPLPYADVIVGIDIARRLKTTLPGSVNLTAQTRIFQSDGQLLQYRIADAIIDGETIPTEVLQQLFPQTLFAGKRVLIQRDGPYRGREKQDLQERAQRIGATFLLVEVIKQGAPRLYGFQPASGRAAATRAERVAAAVAPSGSHRPSSSSQQLENITLPPKGSAMLLSDYEALLVSTLPPSSAATPEPLHIRSEPPFSIREALHSVLALTLLRAGSLRPPRLPISIHYSDELGGLALVGIRPKSAEGTRPFWL